MFPEWEKGSNWTVVYKPKPEFEENRGLMHFLGLTEMEMNHLFVPTQQSPSIFGGEDLGVDATPQEVAKNIYAFMEYVLEKKTKCNTVIK